MKKKWITALLFASLFMAVLAFAQIVETSGSLSLQWDDNAETDLSHYNVYRSDNFGGPYEMLNATSETLPVAWSEVDGNPVVTEAMSGVFTAALGGGALGSGKLTASEFVDLTVESGNVYWYRVTAVDTSWNESDYSDRVGRLVLDLIKPGKPKGLR